MKWLRLVFIAALAIIFIGTTFISIMGAGQVIGQVLKVYVFKYETCEHKYPTVIEPGQEKESTEKECYIDYNGAKRQIAQNLAMFIVAFPIAYFSQRALRRAIKEAGE